MSDIEYESEEYESEDVEPLEPELSEIYEEYESEDVEPIDIEYSENEEDEDVEDEDVEDNYGIKDVLQYIVDSGEDMLKKNEIKYLKKIINRL